MGNHYPECGACQPVRQAADAPKLHTPSRACTSWEQREHKAAALRKIAFLAISEAHQVFHWLPAALCLSRDFGVEVSVLSPSRKMLDFIGSYDEKCVLELVQLRRPFPSRDSLFRLPSRLAVLLLNYRLIASFPFIYPTEVPSAHLRKVPGLSSIMIHLKHGPGDRDGGYKDRKTVVQGKSVAIRVTL